MSGYFLVARGLFEHPQFMRLGALSQLEAWLWLIEHTNYEDSLFKHGYQMFVVPRGSYGTRYRFLASKWHWSVTRVIRVLQMWQERSMIDLETKHGYVHITLCNYDVYQKPWNTNETQTKHKRNTNETQTSTNLIKEIKEKKKIYISAFLEFWKEYPRHDGSKKEASKSYNKAIAKISHEKIMEGVKSYKSYIVSKSVKHEHIAHATTWLNQERWESDYQEPVIPSFCKDPEKEKFQTWLKASAENMNQFFIMRKEIGDNAAMENLKPQWADH